MCNKYIFAGTYSTNGGPCRGCPDGYTTAGLGASSANDCFGKIPLQYLIEISQIFTRIFTLFVWLSYTLMRVFSIWHPKLSFCFFWGLHLNTIAIRVFSFLECTQDNAENHTGPCQRCPSGQAQDPRNPTSCENCRSGETTDELHRTCGIFAYWRNYFSHYHLDRQNIVFTLWP